MHSERYFSSLYAGVTILTNGKDWNRCCYVLGYALQLHVARVSCGLWVSFGSRAPRFEVPDKFHFWGKNTMPQRLSISSP